MNTTIKAAVKVKVLNPIIPAWRALEYVRALASAGNLAKAGLVTR